MHDIEKLVFVDSSEMIKEVSKLGFNYIHIRGKNENAITRYYSGSEYNIEVNDRIVILTQNKSRVVIFETVKSDVNNVFIKHADRLGYVFYQELESTINDKPSKMKIYSNSNFIYSNYQYTNKDKIIFAHSFTSNK